MIASQLDMKKDNVLKIISEDLGMWKVFTKLVPRLLNDDQKECHMQVSKDIIERHQIEPDLLLRVISGDETWIFNPKVNARVVNGRKQDTQSHIDHVLQCEGHR